MENAYENLVDKNDQVFTLEIMIVVRQILEFKSFNNKDQFKLQLIKLILENKYQEVQTLLTDRIKAVHELLKKEMS